MDNKCREILERGGVLTKEEFNLLVESFPATEGYDKMEAGIRYYITLYLPEVRGYCTVYTGHNIYEDDADYAALIEKDREQIAKYLQEGYYKRFLGVNKIERLRSFCCFFYFPKDGEMVFHDLSCVNTFSTLKELEEYYAQYGIPDFLIDPRNDPEFKRIIESGRALYYEDYCYILQYCNYIDYRECEYSDDGLIYNNVIDLGNGEKYMIKMRSQRDVNSPFKPWNDDCLMEGGFRYVKDGVVVKEYDDIPKLVIYKDEEDWVNAAFMDDELMTSD